MPYTIGKWRTNLEDYIFAFAAYAYTLVFIFFSGFFFIFSETKYVYILMPTSKNIYELSLVERDRYVYQIENQIQSKRDLLLQKQKYLEKTMKENAFLEGVRDDYNKYRNHIIHEKQEQLRAMKMLDQYTRDLIENTEKTEYITKQTKRDQKELLDEMNKIKQSLDQIIGDSIIGDSGSK